MKPLIFEFSDRKEASNAIFCEIISKIEQAEKFRLLISGGRTPLPFFEKMGLWLRQNPLQARKIYIAWVDERLVPLSSDQSNYKGSEKLREAIPKDQVYPVPVGADPFEILMQYEQTLKKAGFFENDRLSADFVLLGMGEDGHVASIFPDHRVFKDSKFCQITSPKGLLPRFTIKLSVIEQSKENYALIFGAKKWVLLQKMLNKNLNLPFSSLLLPDLRIYTSKK